ncbi:MAG: hypothetical protein RugAbin2_02223 [Rugosibacter sp.]|jgi:secreted trypsin-like serine protease|nr:hypothetical protein [Rugosibacter sp.]
MSLPSLIFSALFALFSDQAHALMSGANPDSPATHIDPNTVNSPWAGVGSLSITKARGTGTFTAALIAPNYVLTAAHVVTGVPPGAITFNLNFGGNLTQQIGATEIFIHPGYRGFNNPNLNDDLAIVRLARPAIPDVPIYSLLRNALPRGATMTFVGYGSSGSGNTGPTIDSSPAIKRTGQNNADQFTLDDDGSGKAEVYYFDFDGPTAANNLMGGPTLGNTLETSVSGGDSGSPAFIQDSSGIWRLAGVNTFTFTSMQKQTASTFGTGGGGMLVSSYADWIDGIIATPVPEPSTYALLLAGLGLIGCAAFRPRHSRLSRPGHRQNCKPRLHP